MRDIWQGETKINGIQPQLFRYQGTEKERKADQLLNG